VNRPARRSNQHREALEHWTGEVRRLKTELERRFGVEICDDKLCEAIALMNRERAVRGERAELMQADCPPLTGRQLLDLKTGISAIGADLEQYAPAVEGFRAAPGPGGLAPRVRVLMTGVPVVHGAERVIDLIEACGGRVIIRGLRAAKELP